MTFVQRLTEALKPENRRGSTRDLVTVRAADLLALLHHFTRLDDAARAAHNAQSCRHAVVAGGQCMNCGAEV